MPWARRELPLLEACEALLGPGLGFGSLLLANQARLPLKTGYEALWGTLRAPPQFLSSWYCHTSKNENTDLGLQTLGSNPVSY